LIDWTRPYGSLLVLASHVLLVGLGSHDGADASALLCDARDCSRDEIPLAGVPRHLPEPEPPAGDAEVRRHRLDRRKWCFEAVAFPLGYCRLLDSAPHGDSELSDLLWRRRARSSLEPSRQ